MNIVQMSAYRSAPAMKYMNETSNVTDFKDQQVRLVHAENTRMEIQEIGADRTETWKQDSTRTRRCLRWLKTNIFLLIMFGGIIAGLLIGITARSANPGPNAVLWIGMPGELYMRILQAMILPLIACTVIDGTANTDPKSNGRIGLVTVTYILTTNAIGGILGIALCYIIRPGSIRTDEGGAAAPDTRNLQTMDIFADFIRNIFPDNIVGATMFMSQTKYTAKDILVQSNVSGHVMNWTAVKMTKSIGSVSATNILGLIVISSSIGIAASQVKDKVRPFIDFFNSGARIIFQLFSWVNWTTPVGVASLIASALVKIDNLGSAFSSMGLFVLTTSGGCIIYQLTVLPLILVVVTRRNPLKLFPKMFKLWIMAFGPASSTIPLPEMIRISEEVYRVDPRVAGFTLPFCTTLNRDGSCIFIAATCLFIAQYTGTNLDTGEIFTLAVLSFMASLAIPAVPSSSVVAILIILGSLGISSENIGLVMAVDWLNDRVRSTSNVTSHMVAALVTWRLCRESLRKTAKTEEHLNDVKDIDIL